MKKITQNENYFSLSFKESNSYDIIIFFKRIYNLIKSSFYYEPVNIEKESNNFHFTFSDYFTEEEHSDLLKNLNFKFKEELEFKLNELEKKQKLLTDIYNDYK